MPATPPSATAVAALKGASSTDPPVAVIVLAVAPSVTWSATKPMRGFDAAVALRVAPVAAEPSCRVPPLTATSKNRLLPV